MVKKSTLREEINELKINMSCLTRSFIDLRKDFRDYQGFVKQSHLDMLISMRDLYDRLQYIKSYIGVDEFFEACRKGNHDHNNPSS